MLLIMDVRGTPSLCIFGSPYSLGSLDPAGRSCLLVSKFEIKNTLHVSEGLSIHHQVSKTVHTASYHTGSVAACKQAATEPV